jgi:hypothetical protein
MRYVLVVIVGVSYCIMVVTSVALFTLIVMFATMLLLAVTGWSEKLGKDGVLFISCMVFTLTGFLTLAADARYGIARRIVRRILGSDDQV